MVCYVITRHTSNMQNGERQVGQGHRQLSQISGCVWSCRLANHLPMHSRHHIGRQRQLRQGDMVSASSVQRRLSLIDAAACMQPTHWSNSYTDSRQFFVNKLLTIYYFNKKQLVLPQDQLLLHNNKTIMVSSRWPSIMSMITECIVNNYFITSIDNLYLVST